MFTSNSVKTNDNKVSLELCDPRVMSSLGSTSSQSKAVFESDVIRLQVLPLTPWELAVAVDTNSQFGHGRPEMLERRSSNGTRLRSSVT